MTLSTKVHFLERQPWLGALLVALCGLVYLNSLHGAFVYDDFVTIVDNPHIESLWPLSKSLTAPVGSGASGRPIVALSFALNYAVGAREVFGYHLFNLFVHVGAGLALFGCVRQALLALRRRAAAHLPATLAATCVAALWMVHPLNTAALNHVTYRNEALLAFFYLATIYFDLRGLRATRGEDRGRSALWLGASVLTCALAMGCKEIAVSLPLAALLLNVTLFDERLLQALRRHALYYAGLASTWLLLAWLVSMGDRGESVGAGSEGIDTIAYFRTELGVLVHYLRLVVWPAPLVLDYRDWGIVASWSEVLPQAALLLTLFGAACLALWRRKPLGAVALAIFAVLAPTSSFIPITGAIAAEHRMYLPLAGLLILAGAALTFALQRLKAQESRVAAFLLLVTLLAGAPLAWATVQRNADYESELTIWEDTVQKRPNNSLAWVNYGGALYRLGRKAECEQAVRRAIDLHPGNYKALDNLGLLLREKGDLRAAAETYERAVHVRPDLGNAHYELGRVLIELGEFKRGMASWDEALRRGLPAADQERVAFQLATAYATAEDDDLRNGMRALELAQQLDKQSGGQLPHYLDLLAAAQAERGLFAEAQVTVERAMQLADAAGRAKLAASLRQKLANYADGKPWRQPLR